MKSFITYLFAAILLFVLSDVSYSQGLFDKIKDKVKERVDQKTDEGIDKGLDETEEAIEEGVEKKEAEAEESEVEESEDEESSVEINSKENKNSEERADKQPVKESLKSYSKYDFMPGEKVIFYEDFSQDNVGDFPVLWYTNKGGEVITTNLFKGKWFQMREDGMYYLDKGLPMPENFTLEFDVIPKAEEDIDAQSVGFDLTLLEIEQDELFPTMYVPGKGGVILNLNTPNAFHSYSGYFDSNYGVNGEYTKEKALLKRDEVNHVCIWIQKTRVRVYMHGEKVFDVPKALNSSLKLNQLRFWIPEESAPMFSNFRIAEAGADMRSKLITEGKLVTRGILFDVNSDKIKPESYGTLKEIANVLKENPDVKVKIVGHTDSDGSDDSNLDLSKRRAASVKVTLNKDFGIDEARMETDGKGESEPSDKNDTLQGKANNRRVEFIKL